MQATRTASTWKESKPKAIPCSWRGVTISATIRKLKDPGVVILTTSPFHSPLWPVQTRDGSWRMTVDNCKPNKMVTPVSVIVPGVVSSPGEISTSLGAS